MKKDLLALLGVFILSLGFYIYGMVDTRAPDGPEISVVEYQYLVDLERKDSRLDDFILSALSDSKITHKEFAEIQSAVKNVGVLISSNQNRIKYL